MKIGSILPPKKSWHWVCCKDDCARSCWEKGSKSITNLGAAKWVHCILTKVTIQADGKVSPPISSGQISCFPQPNLLAGKQTKIFCKQIWRTSSTTDFPQAKKPKFWWQTQHCNITRSSWKKFCSYSSRDKGLAMFFSEHIRKRLEYADIFFTWAVMCWKRILREQGYPKQQHAVM